MTRQSMTGMFLILPLTLLAGCGPSSSEEGPEAATNEAQILKVAPGRVVSIRFTVHDGAGKQLEASTEGEPLSFLYGSGTLPAPLEKKVLGLTPGDSVDVTLPPEQAYGHRDEALVVEVPRENLANIENLQPGMQLMADRQFPVTVLEVGEGQVTIDENHPWAGLTLRYNVEVVAVRDAAPEEVSHGHVHGPGGVEHQPSTD